MKRTLVIEALDETIRDLKGLGEEYYESVDQLGYFKNRVESGEFHGTVHDVFNDRIKDLGFSEETKKKILYQIIKDKPGSQWISNNSYTTRSPITDGNSYVLQATLHPDGNCHVVITHSLQDRYNEFGSEEFQKLFVQF